MTLALDFPVCSHSFLGRFDPRWKLAALMLAALAAALVRTLPCALAALAGALSLTVAARLPLRWLFARLAGVGLAFAFFLSWLPFIHSETGPRWDLGWVTLSSAGLG